MDKKIKNDYKKLKQKVSLLKKSVKFKDLCRELEKRWGKVKNALDVPAREIDANRSRIKFGEDLAKIRAEFDLGPEWDGSILDFALYGKNLDVPFQRVSIYPDPFNKKIIIELGQSATLDEIKMRWPIVEEWKKYVFGKKRSSLRDLVNLERDEEIWYLHEQGKSYKEILDIVDETYNLGYDAIRKACKRYEKRLKVRKNPRTDNLLI